MVNQFYSQKVLWHPREQVQCEHPEWWRDQVDCFTTHYSARSLLVQQFLAGKCMAMVHHLPY